MDLKPKRIEGAFVFIFLSKAENWKDLPIIACFLEEDGVSLLMHKKDADQLHLAYEDIFALITLDIFSSLTEVGLTAKVSTALAKEHIACNVIAAFHHDHLLVPYRAASDALIILRNLVPC